MKRPAREMDPVGQLLPPRRLAGWVAALALATACAPRAPAVDLTGRTWLTIDGDTFAFSDKAGQVLLVTYFATWCFPCIAEVPDLIDLQNRFGPKGFSVVAIGLDEKAAELLQPFRDYYRIPYPILLPDEDARRGKSPFGDIVGLPTSFLLDRHGRLARSVYGFVSGQALADEVQKALQ